MLRLKQLTYVYINQTSVVKHQNTRVVEFEIGVIS